MTIHFFVFSKPFPGVQIPSEMRLGNCPRPTCSPDSRGSKGPKESNSETMHLPSTMPTHAAVVATSPTNSGDNGAPQRNSYARVAGSACAGVSELLLFHPVDTVAKRLMSNQTVSVKGKPTAEAMVALNQVRARKRMEKCIV